MDRRQRVADEIAHFFRRNFDIELEDSPQILDKYLYLEFWHRDKQIKVRATYPVDAENFLRIGAYARELFVMKEVLKII